MDQLIQSYDEKEAVDALFFPELGCDAAGHEVCGEVKDAVGSGKPHHGFDCAKDENSAESECSGVDGNMQAECIKTAAFVGCHPAALQQKIGYPMQPKQHYELPKRCCCDQFALHG